MIFNLDLPHLHKLDPVVADEKYLIDLMYHFSITSTYCPSDTFIFVETSDYRLLVIDGEIQGAIDSEDCDCVWLSITLRERWESI